VRKARSLRALSPRRESAAMSVHPLGHER
jgi:hypothetical protein